MTVVASSGEIDLSSVLTHDLWNHANYLIPTQNMTPLKACLAELMPWDRFVDTEHMLGYRFRTNYEFGSVYFQPSEHVATFTRELAEARRQHPALDEAMTRMASLAPEVCDHTGFVVTSRDEWEARLAKFEAAATEHPEWELAVPGVTRPEDPDALTDTLGQAWIRIGLLGPVRNTFEMQFRNPRAPSTPRAR